MPKENNNNEKEAWCEPSIDIVNIAGTIATQEISESEPELTIINDSICRTDLTDKSDATIIRSYDYDKRGKIGR